MENRKYLNIAICKRCKVYEQCKKNKFKHPLNGVLLPIISKTTNEVIRLYNLMKIGVKFDYDNMMETSNKYIELLQDFTSAVNEKNVSKFGGSNE